MSRDHDLPAAARAITIVGGGFSGVSAAIQLVRASRVPLAITLVESRGRVGPGLAYSTPDPDHRLNAPTWVHSVDPFDAGHFTRWCEAHRIFERDPEGLRPDGSAYARRGVFGDYLEDVLRDHAYWPANGSTIKTLRDTATGAARTGGTLNVFTASGRVLPSELLIVATGNPLPRLQSPLAPALAWHPGVIENPLDAERLLEIPPAADVLLIGSGLTSLDVLSTLLRRGHAGRLVVVSRRGLRPRAQPPSTGPAVPITGRENLERLLKPAPAFLDEAVVPATVRAWLRALRTQIAAAEDAGGTWHAAFDELRDAVWQLWPRLPKDQKRRFLRKLRTWYDVHRFRSPPQNREIVEQAEAAGRIEYRAARLRSAVADPAAGRLTVEFGLSGAVRQEAFDVIVNCTGLDPAARTASNPLLSALVEQGWLTPDDAGIGYAVDAACRALGADGQPLPAVRLIGPPTLGTFGDPGGALFIAAQIHRLLPDLLGFLEAAGAGPAAHAPEASIA